MKTILMLAAALGLSCVAPQEGREDEVRKVKQRMAEVQEQMKLAEERGDKEAAQLLRDEARGLKERLAALRPAEIDKGQVPPPEEQKRRIDEIHRRLND